MTDDPQLEDDMPVEPTSGMDDGAERTLMRKDTVPGSAVT